MPSLPDLPVEILHAIATTLRMMAVLARTNRRLYDIVNPALYGENISYSTPTKLCVLWGAQYGRLGTVKLGHQHGGSLNLDIKDTNWPRSGANKSWTGDSYVTNCGTALQLAVRHGHRDIIGYLLDHGADVHSPSLACCHCRSLGRLSYPLHEVVCATPRELRHCRRRNENEAVAKDLMQRGACLEGPGRPALHPLIVQDRLDLIVSLLEHSGARVWDGACMADTPLHVAGGFGRTDIARVLLARGDFNVSALDNTMCTAAEKAAQGVTSAL